MKRRLITRKWVSVTILSLSVLTMFAPSVTQAGSATGNFSSTANLSPSCTITGGTLSFGAFQPQASGTTAARGSIVVLCTTNSPYDILVSAGNSNNELQRSMTGNISSDNLQYNIYTDTTYTTVIGDETNGTSHPMNGIFNGRPVTNGLSAGRNAYLGGGRPLTWYLYGVLNNNQYVTPDNYTDNLTVTLNY